MKVLPDVGLAGELGLCRWGSEGTVDEVVVAMQGQVHLFKEDTVKVWGCNSQMMAKNVAGVAEELLSRTV